MCRLIFETVKWEDGAPCLLPWHQRRVEAAMNLHGAEGSAVPDLASVLAAVAANVAMLRRPVRGRKAAAFTNAISRMIRRERRAVPSLNLTVPGW